MAPTGDPAAMGRQDLRKKRETTMYVSMTGKAQSEQSRVNATWRNAWTVQSRKSSNSSQRMSIGGNKRRTRANTLPLVFPQARRKDGSSWAPYIGSARRNTTASSSNSAGGTTRRTAKLASKQSADAARDKCQRS